MSNNNNDGHKVGYGKPPKKTQFKRGQSGNPKGRPKGTKNKKVTFNAIMEMELNMNTPDGAKPVSFREAIFKIMQSKALNDKDIRMILKLVELDRVYNPEFYEVEDLDNPYKRIKALEAELAVEKQRTAGGVLVVHEQESVEEWVKGARKLRDKMLYPDGNAKDIDEIEDDD